MQVKAIPLFTRVSFFFICVQSIIAVNSDRYNTHLSAHARVARPQELSENSKARSELAALVADNRRRISLSQPQDLRSSRLDTMDGYLDFIHRHQNAKVSPTAKMLYGFTMLTSNDPNYTLASEKHFQDLASSYAGFEGELSKRYFLPYLAMIKEDDDSRTLDRLLDFQASLKAVLPIVRNYDALIDPLALGVRQTMAPHDPYSLEAPLTVELARVTLELGDRDKAIGLFRQVETRFAGTVWARKASRSIRTIQYLEQKGRPYSGRLGLSRVQRQRTSR